MGGVGEGLWLEKGTWRHFGQTAQRSLYFVVHRFTIVRVSITISLLFSMWLYRPKAKSDGKTCNGWVFCKRIYSEAHSEAHALLGHGD